MNKREYRGCTLCWVFGSPLSYQFNSPCWHCGFDKECFTLDKKKLEEEVRIGFRSKRQAERIIRRYEEDQGIPEQRRLPW